MASDTARSLPPAKRRARGCLTFLLRGLKWLLIILVLAVIAGVGYQTIATASDKNTYAPPGQIVDVGGQQMHIHCTGEGSPTIILEAGGISYSTEWYWVQQQLSQTNRVCSYDRAGNGWSEPRPEPRDGLQVAGELHNLLAETDILPPYVLVGHSYGGVINRIYAHQYPAEAAGIVLVDTAVMRPDTFADRAAFQQWKSENDILQFLLWGMVRTGLYRLVIGNDLRGFGYPATVADELIAMRATNQSFDTYYAEGIAARLELTEQSKAAEALGDLPLMVLWATKNPPLSPADQELYQSIQRSVATFSSNSASRYIQDSDHGSIIGNEAYAGQVSDAVRDLIDAVANSQPLAN